MTGTSRKRKPPRERSLGRNDRGSAGDGLLAILVDERNGREYYVSILDTFSVRGQAYTVMYNYEPDDGSRANPELVIMRSWKDESGEHVFSSVTSRKELDRAFEIFFERYAGSLSRP
ncbi:MAG TPA: DUF1292 domain-containing protein [Bacillota bacterium]|jgi:uncharacterized protein YrzB (UPF0473 family)|nr:DUF1292 domain-containing protein [Fastidiosipila sp.]HPX92717.1 DUF1292 domain-containing protein [Bacillota bacterium]HQB80614.1 DUF1292 domain-containing protein [Bacillota bacterium]